jgi:5'-3' exonuclease
MLLDAASMYFRAFYGVPTSVTASDGTPVNAVRGFTEMVASLVTRYSPTRLVACLDEDWRPAWRVALLPSYKAQRVLDPTVNTADATATIPEAIPDELAPQVPILLALLDAYGIANVGVADHEADDVIGTLATREGTRSGRDPEAERVDIVTGDRDLLQLIDDESGIRVLYTGRGMAKLEEIGDAGVTAKYGVGPSQYADFATLRGDPSDGLPGVPGIGAKTAAGLLGRYGSLTGLLEAVDARDPALPATQWRRLNDARDYLKVAPTVVAVVRDCKIPDVADVLPTEPADPKIVAALAKRWNLDGPTGRLTTALAR